MRGRRAAHVACLIASALSLLLFGLGLGRTALTRQGEALIIYNVRSRGGSVSSRLIASALSSAVAYLGRAALTKQGDVLIICILRSRGRACGVPHRLRPKLFYSLGHAALTRQGKL